MDRLDAIRLFVRVVECGSFAAAAREAGVGQPAVSKQIAALEAHLGAQLMRRTSRSMSLTEAGQTFYESAVKLVGELEAAESQVGLGQSAPTGLIRVAVPPVFGRLYIVPELPEFLARYPKISLELSVSSRTIHLIEDGIDLAIHHGELADSSMTATRIATTPFVTVATPGYLALHGVPATPSDLASHACVIFAPRREPRAWMFEDRSGAIVHHPQGRLRTSDGEQIRAAVLTGLGLAHAPAWLFLREIASGAVRVVLQDYEAGSLPISAVHPAGRRLPTKIRVFIEFFADRFARNPSLALR